MINKHLEITCDWCGKKTSVNTGDELKAIDRTRKFGWIWHSVGYGNELQYCGGTCRDCGLEALQEHFKSQVTVRAGK